MAIASIVLPTNNLNQEHRCKKHKCPRYYKLKWIHLTIPLEVAKDVLNSALLDPFYAVFSSIPCYSLQDMMDCPYNGLDWDEVDGVYLERSLEVLVDTGVITHCAAYPCRQSHLTIPLGGQTPSVKSFRTSGLQFYDIEGVLVQDRGTVFDRVYREQAGLESLSGEKIGRPIVKSVKYVCAY
jgi:hypothetical protein